MEKPNLLPPKLCPLSFGFSLKQQIPSMIDPKKVDMRIQVGFSCLKEKCELYSIKIEACVIWQIATSLITLLEGKTEVV